MPNVYYVLLGRTPQLSLAELSALTHQSPTIVIEDLIAAVSCDSDEAAHHLFATTAGSLKLLKPVGEFSSLSLPELSEHIVAYLAQFPKPTFGLAEFGRNHLPKIDVAEIKDALKARGLASRFIDSERSGLSAAVQLHHPKVIELAIITLPTGVTIFAQTLAVQDIDDWTLRDRGKPYADRKKGMLPPKVARMMVNMATGFVSEKPASDTLIYDPFCGSGTVLMEALMLGYDVVGSDLDTDAVAGTKNNLTWLQNRYTLEKRSTEVLFGDATHVKPSRPVDMIVTEPFLGKPRPQLAQLPNMFRGLEKLYLGAFKHWTSVLVSGARVVMVWPVVEIEGKRFSLEGMIDKLTPLGYTPVSTPVFYHRPQAVIQRQIWSFTYVTR